MNTVVAILFIAAFIAGYVMYANWLKKGIRSRTYVTKASPDDLRRIFAAKVASSGWKVVDDGNPVVAQSPLITGIRQQIAMHMQQDDGGIRVKIGPQRWVTKWGVPKKGHTIRFRLNGFESALRQLDSTATSGAVSS